MAKIPEEPRIATVGEETAATLPKRRPPKLQDIAAPPCLRPLVITRRDHVSETVGQFGWDGGLGTSWRSDPREEMVTILMTQRAWTSPSPPDVCLDFWTSAQQAIDD